jgi:fatty-acid desaturase
MRSKFNIAMFWLSHLLFFGLASFDSYLVVIGIAWSWIVLTVGLQIGAHRYFTHSSFTANKFQSGVMNVIAIMAAMGTPQDWMVAHIAHHKYSDTEKDPTNWRVIGLFKNYTSLWQLNVPITQDSMRLVVRSLQNGFSKFIYNNYIKILSLWGLALFLIDTQLFVWVFVLPILVGHWCMNLLNHIGHLGNKNGSTTNTSLFFNVLTPGDGYHDFHHQNPRLYRYGKYDLLALIIDVFLKSKLSKTVV